MRKAFTLIELLVVVTIMLILFALLLPRVGRIIANAREQTCRTNLKNLQAACIAYATEQGSSGGSASLPYAGSHEVYDLLTDQWFEKPGWVRWLGNGKWGIRKGGPQREIMRSGGIFGEDAKLAIRKGTIYEYTNKEIGTYRCPVAAKSFGGNCVLTYKMNGFFYFLGRPSWRGRVLSWMGTKEYTSADSGEKSYSVVPEANRILLFAESTGDQIAPTSGGDNCGPDSNCTIHAPAETANQTGVGNATLGAYHYGPTKKDKWSLVIFLDGHIEKVNPSTEGESDMTFKNRAWYLCSGLEADPAGMPKN